MPDSVLNFGLQLYAVQLCAEFQNVQIFAHNTLLSLSQFIMVLLLSALGSIRIRGTRCMISKFTCYLINSFQIHYKFTSNPRY